MGPMVSVVIPTYKRSEMLPRAISSVLTQTYNNIQVVVVDDNNPDSEYRIRTAEIMHQFADDIRVKYVLHEKNMNGSVARNTGIKNADGDIVAFLDDDDFFYHDKIEKQVDYLLLHPEFRAVYCGWDRDGKKVIPTDEGDLSYNILSGDHIIYTNVIMMWKKDAIECGGWDETFQRHQEAAFLLRYFRNNGKIGVVNEVLVEFDISDRTNAAANSRKNEKQTMHYLTSYQDMIEKCELRRKGTKKSIYTHRCRGMLLSYIKEKDVIGAISFYFRRGLKYPVAFNACLIEYAFNRCCHK